MKKTVKGCVALLALTALTSASYAANPGAYAGFGLGVGKQDTQRNTALAPNQDALLGTNLSYSHKQDKLAGRIFAGYNINQNFGVELGLAKYGNSKYNGSYYLASQGLQPGYMSATSSLEYSMTALDLVGKGYLPVAEGFNVYALGGLALVHSEVKAKTNSIIDFVGVTQASSSYSSKQNKVRPIVGLGASYDIPQTKLTTNLEFSHIHGSGNVKTSNKAIPSANMITLNLAYNFG